MGATERLVVAGSIAQRPYHGGHTWVFLQYLLGFRDLDWDVLFLDRLEPDMCFDARGRRCRPEDSVNLSYLQEVMGSFGFERAYAVLCDGGKRWLGLSRKEALKRIEGSAFLLNVNGFVTAEEVLERVSLRVFLDIDPGFGQMWRELGLHDLFRGHDVYVTVAENMGDPSCTIPTCGLRWITSRQPVVLDLWPSQSPEGNAFTSVGSWRGPNAAVDYRGKRYGLRVHEFRKFVELPHVTGRRFTIALDIDPSDAKDRELLGSNGWAITDPKEVARDPAAYRKFIQGSWGEFMVAKNMYVQTWSGWFSDRSACYLAGAKPVLAQDTGFTRLLPTGDGLLAFRTFDEAAAAVEDICRRYSSHTHAARSLAEEYFDSRKVLSRLLGELGLV